jgi:hypothetical protein
MIKAYVLIQVQVGRSSEVSGEIVRIESVTSSDVVSGPYDVIAGRRPLTSTTSASWSLRGSRRSTASLAR